MMRNSNNVHELSGAKTPGPAGVEARKVLIVDDEPTIQLTLSYALRAVGYEVVTASRLESAEAALER
jgi:PleD family two-component response regulator